MVQLQILNKVLATKDLKLLTDNGITADYFTEYADEYSFILDHYNNYKDVPDIESVVAKFSDFNVLDVSESDRYLIDTIREEYLYTKSVPVIKKAVQLLKGDANAASQYLQSELSNLTPNYTTPFMDIIHSDERLKMFESKGEDKNKWYITTGFEELDDIVGGWQKGEEYVVIFARTGQGKSWVLVKSLQHAWEIGNNVGYISPEMSGNKIGYRFDTMYKNYSNTALTRGDTETISVDDYTDYYNALSQKENKFLVSTPRDFNNEVTVSKLRTFVTSNNLDILGVDGISYMKDERYKRGDNLSTTLKNISEDLMNLSCELKIPILVVVQSNRGGVEKDTPDIEDIRDSDGISFNATKIISLKQKDAGLVMQIKKNRDGRNGDKLTYLWDIDIGNFQWIPSDDDTAPQEEKRERKVDMKKQAHEDKKKVVF